MYGMDYITQAEADYRVNRVRQGWKAVKPASTSRTRRLQGLLRRTGTTG